MIGRQLEADTHASDPELVARSHPGRRQTARWRASAPTDEPILASMAKLGWLVPGGACEVLMQEEGLWGSHYTAKILEVTKQKAKIEFEVRKTPDTSSATHPLVGLRQE